MPEERFVGYCRASTASQTLSLALQRESIERFIATSGGKLVGWFEEITRASPPSRGIARHQPGLVLALARAHAQGATLVVARLDRLTRSAAMLSVLIEDNTPIVVADTPSATRMMLR